MRNLHIRNFNYNQLQSRWIPNDLDKYTNIIIIINAYLYSTNTQTVSRKENKKYRTETHEVSGTFGLLC